MKLVLLEVRAHIITDHFIPKVQMQAETKWSEELMKEIGSSNVSARMEKKKTVNACMQACDSLNLDGFHVCMTVPVCAAPCVSLNLNMACCGRNVHCM